MNKGSEMKRIVEVGRVSPGSRNDNSQMGASLIVVMIILTVVSLLGVAGIQISMMSERGARNDRDRQVAWQSAEAALMDAEFDMFGPGPSTRRASFSSDVSAFAPGCGSSGISTGLCEIVGTGKPAWLTVSFEATGSTARTAEFGAFTGRSFAAGGIGVQPAKRPRYVIEAIPDQFGAGAVSRNLSSGDVKYVYRVTSMGFGPRDDIQAVLQMIYRN